MRICVVGSGYVGLVTGACFADSGNHVTAVDRDAERIRELQSGRCPFFEPGLEELMRANSRAERLCFTTDLAAAIANAQVIFLAVGTPPRADGSADLSALESVAAEIGRHLRTPAIAVVKSTAPVGTGARIEEIIRRATKHACPVVSNPEFLKEGNAVNDFFKPDRVVIGAEDPAAAERVADLYRPFVRNNKPILIMPRAAAELTKYAANAYLATRISFINEIAEICQRLGVDVDFVRRGIGADERIGQHFLYPGVGYGGSCFPKDVQALSSFGRAAGADCKLLDAVHTRNQRQRSALLDLILRRLGLEVASSSIEVRKSKIENRIAVWGLAFKPKTDDIREAPAITLIEGLLQAGVAIAAHDPHALAPTRAYFADRSAAAGAAPHAGVAQSSLAVGITYHEDAYAALAGADALLICTEWMEFRSPDFDRIRAALKQPLIFDGRNIYDPAMLRRLGFEYHSIGRPVRGAERVECVGSGSI